MSFSFSTRLRAETLRSLAFGSIGAAYMGVGTAFNQPIRLIHIQNLTDTLLIYSFNGIDDHLAIPESGFLLLDITANKTREEGWYIAEGDRIYVREDTASPTSGSTYISAFYGSIQGS